MITTRQYIFTLLDLIPGLDRYGYGQTFWVGYPAAPSGQQTQDASIVQWDVEGVAQPEQDAVLARWGLIKDNYVDPFS